jgi:mannan endo-1,4-beta-mannosidase
VRPFALNLVTASATLLLLAVLALPAWMPHARPLAGANAHASAAWASKAPASGRLFGIYTDPWHLAAWSRRVGIHPSLVAKFEAFARRRTVDSFLRQVERDGVSDVMVTWEPWKPVPAALGGALQAQRQPGYANADIAAGSQDRYIARFARSLATFRGTVYLRYAHEMNGFWYPWSAGPRAYVKAWRRIVRIVRKQGARNVRFVWSTNANLYESARVWLHNARRYWPGSRYVDAVGSTMINFGGDKQYSVARFEPRLAILRRVFRKPVFLTEVNTDHRTRLSWLRGLRRLVHTHRWIRAVAWSQLPSRGKAHRGALAGDVNWNVANDRAAAAQLRAVARDDSS